MLIFFLAICLIILISNVVCEEFLTVRNYFRIKKSGNNYVRIKLLKGNKRAKILIIFTFLCFIIIFASIFRVYWDDDMIINTTMQIKYILIALILLFMAISRFKDVYSSVLISEKYIVRGINMVSSNEASYMLNYNDSSNMLYIYKNDCKNPLAKLPCNEGDQKYINVMEILNKNYQNSKLIMKTKSKRNTEYLRTFIITVTVMLVSCGLIYCVKKLFV